MARTSSWRLLSTTTSSCHRRTERAGRMCGGHRLRCSPGIAPSPRRKLGAVLPTTPTRETAKARCRSLRISNQSGDLSVSNQSTTYRAQAPIHRKEMTASNQPTGQFNGNRKLRINSGTPNTSAALATHFSTPPPTFRYNIYRRIVGNCHNLSGPDGTSVLMDDQLVHLPDSS